MVFYCSLFFYTLITTIVAIAFTLTVMKKLLFVFVKALPCFFLSPFIFLTQMNMKTTLLQLSLYFLVLLSACKKNTPSATSNTTETTSTVTVTFNSNGGTSISVQSINSGATAAQPTNPTKTNYTFEGWYSDAALTTPFSFSTAITSNITLYAKFAIAKSTVTFNSRTLCKSHFLVRCFLN